MRTQLGKIQVRIRKRSSGSQRLDLCRNGMWITDDKRIPGFYYAFRDRKPFHAILLLDSGSGGRLHELVRNAEGPLHDKLDREATALKFRGPRTTSSIRRDSRLAAVHDSRDRQ